jgi:diacylglycerol kinase (ATP)
MRAELIYNPYAGQVDARHALQEAADFLSRSGWQITWHVVDHSHRATEITQKAVGKGAQVVIAAGGDGTINEIVNGLAGSDTALGVLPTGTTNVWAMQIGIPTLNPLLLNATMSKLTGPSLFRKILLDAARVIVEGRTVTVDIGEAAGKYFLLWTGVGMDAAIIQNVEMKSKKRLGSWAYVMPAIDTAREYSETPVKINIDGETISINTPMVVITNIQLYGGRLPIGAKACVNDARLDVCIFKGEGFFTFVHQTFKVLSKQHLRDPGIEYRQFKELVIESARPLPVHVDGEAVTETPVTVRTVPSALKVIVPRNMRGNLFL